MSIRTAVLAAAAVCALAVPAQAAEAPAGSLVAEARQMIVISRMLSGMDHDFRRVSLAEITDLHPEVKVGSDGTLVDRKGRVFRLHAYVGANGKADRMGLVLANTTVPECVATFSLALDGLATGVHVGSDDHGRGGAEIIEIDDAAKVCAAAAKDGKVEKVLVRFE